jgi:hypothetical protein
MQGHPAGQLGWCYKVRGQPIIQAAQPQLVALDLLHAFTNRLALGPYSWLENEDLRSWPWLSLEFALHC